MTASDARAPSLIYGTAWKKEATTDLVERALDLGFRALDTANQPKHYREDLVGDALAALAERGVGRDQLYLQTKFTPLPGHGSDVPYDTEAPVAEQVRQSFRQSLRHLRTDHLDAYLLHGPCWSPGLGERDWEAWRVLEELHASGKARAIGISNVNEQQLGELADAAIVSPHVVQNRCFASRGWDAGVRRFCRRHGIEHQAFSLLTANPDVMAHPDVAAIADRLGKTVPQVIYRFALQIGMTPLTGTTDEQHVREALAVDHFALEDDEVARIEVLG